MDRFNFEIPLDLKKQFQKILIDKERSMAEVVREMIHNYVKFNKQKGEAI